MASEGRKEPTASVIIPVFNYSKYVGAAIRSCLEQLAPADEIIVVDDGSVAASNKPGVSAARNVGVHAPSREDECRTFAELRPCI